MLRRASIALANKLAALLILAGLLAALGHFVIGPVARRLDELQSSIATQRGLLGALRAVAADTAPARAAEARVAELSAAGLYLPGETTAIASANLQTLVRETATQHGVRIATARSLPPIDRDGLSLIGVRIEFSAGLDAVQKVVHELERRRPWLVVEGADLSVSARSEQRKARELPQVETGLSIYAALRIAPQKATP